MAIEIFRRKEQKYLISIDQYNELVHQISPYMRADKFGSDGRYTVSSLYFESNDNKIYFETKNKLRYRQKLRLRVYNDTDINGTAFFEVKQKHKRLLISDAWFYPYSKHTVIWRMYRESRWN